MLKLTTGKEILDELLSGSGLETIEASFRRLTADEKQTCLCEACYILDELRTNCVEPADEIAKLLDLHCRFFVSGRRSC